MNTNITKGLCVAAAMLATTAFSSTINLELGTSTPNAVNIPLGTNKTSNVEIVIQGSGVTNRPWAVGETLTESFDIFVVQAPSYSGSAMSMGVGIADGTRAVGFGWRYNNASTLNAVTDVDTTASGAGSFSVDLGSTSTNKVLMTNIQGTIADLRDTGDSAHMVFTATKVTATNYSMSFTWSSTNNTISQTTSQDIVLTNAADEVTSLKSHYVRLNGTNGIITLTNMVMKVVNPTNTLIYTAGANGSLSGDTNQIVLNGGSGTAVTAVGDAGYYMQNWSDGSTNNPRVDTNVTENLAVTANFSPVGTRIGTYQIGGLAAERNIGWGSMSASGSTGTLSFTNDTDTNLVFTVTAVAGSNDTLYTSTAFLAVDSYTRTGDTQTSRLNGDEFITLSLSYVDPNGALRALEVDKVGPYWGQGTGETTVFTDASANSTNIVAFDHTIPNNLIPYATMGLDALTTNNTGSWTMKVSADDTLGTTTSGMGAFRLKYTVTIPSAGEPPVIGSGANVSGGNFNFQFTGTLGSHYVVQYTPVLPAPGPWQTVTDIVSLATSPLAISAPATNSTGFYRVGLVP